LEEKRMTSSDVLAPPIDPKLYEHDPVWGPNSYPAKETIEEGSPPWKDHVYLAFWDPTSRAYGFFHWNSSPNHPTTKAQLNLALGDTLFDLREDLPARADRFDSESMRFDLRSNITIDHPRLKGELTLTPRLKPIDYGPSGSIPRLGDLPPLQHFQHPLTMNGQLTLDGETHQIAATGYRTRTWGYRDDSAQFPEYYYLWAAFDDFDLSVIKHVHPDGKQRTGGALINEAGTLPIVDVHIPKDAAGFAAETRYELADGSEIRLVNQERLWGGWCPIGLPYRDGPTFAAFDEILRLHTPDGQVGYGQSEYGNIRRVH
jgi:hypothetical protein